MNQPLRSNRKSASIISATLYCYVFCAGITLASVFLMSFNQLNPISIYHKCKLQKKKIIIIKDKPARRVVSTQD